MANLLDPVELKALAIELAAAMPPLPQYETGPTRRPLSLVVHEAISCLRSADDLLTNYRGDDEKADRMDRIERASGLVDAAQTVLRSLFGEEADHG